VIEPENTTVEQHIINAYGAIKIAEIDLVTLFQTKIKSVFKSDDSSPTEPDESNRLL
jgi:hypothetical protein